MSDRRYATQAVMISLVCQFDLIEALLESGALSAQAALPLVARIQIISSAWATGGYDDLAVDLPQRAHALLDILKTRVAP